MADGEGQEDVITERTFLLEENAVQEGGVANGKGVQGKQPSCHKRCMDAMGLRIVVILLVFLTVILVFTIVFMSGNVLPKERRLRPSAISGGPFQRAVVQTESTACSKIGYSVLQRNGSAVDAAVAVQFCVTAAVPQSAGVGGGFFMTIGQRSRLSEPPKVVVINGRDAAPLALGSLWLDIPEGGVLSISVPRELAGLYTAWRRFGRMPWRDLIRPTVKLLEEGVVIERALAESLQKMEGRMALFPGLRSLFTKEDGTLLKEGDTYVNRKLAQTLREVALDPNTIYNGSVARNIAADIQDEGGIITEEDFQSMEAKVVPAFTTRLPNRKVTMYSPPPPSGGAIVQYILRILDGYNMTADDFRSKSAVLTLHRMIEAFKFGFAKRSGLADEDSENVTEILSQIAEYRYVEKVRQSINDTCSQPVAYYEPYYQLPRDHGTGGHNVIGPDGTAVSTTSSINDRFGSRIIGRRTGIIFNNGMADFSSPHKANMFGIAPSIVNFAKPGKIPMSSMSPTLFYSEDSGCFMSIYATGGPTIITAVSQVAFLSLYSYLSLTQAVASHRVHHQLLPDVVEYEEGFDQKIIDGLKSKCHTMRLVRKIAVVGAAATESEPNLFEPDTARGQLYGVSDGRKGGIPVGY